MNQNLLDNLCVFISETKQNNAYDIYNDWAKKNNLRLSYEESKFYVGYINRFIFIRDTQKQLFKNTVDHIKEMA